MSNGEMKFMGPNRGPPGPGPIFVTQSELYVYVDQLR
jgi:hypothetical protein